MVRNRWKPSPSDVELIAELWAARMPLSHVAERIGVDEFILRQWLTRVASAPDPDEEFARRRGRYW
jgi:hypothetical protein